MSVLNYDFIMSASRKTFTMLVNEKISVTLIIKFFLISSMGATLFVQPLDLVKNRMQLSGEGGGQRMYKNSFQAITTILRSEGVTGIYTGYNTFVAIYVKCTRA